VRVLLQRASKASVTVEGTLTGRIGPGLVLLVGFTAGDGTQEVEWMAEKVVGLRVFPDERGRMNHSVVGAEGEILVGSQFTLYGGSGKGRRPSFVDAAPPEVARPLYEEFVRVLADRLGREVPTGKFGASMEVSLVNDGPVTLMLERP